MTDPSTFRQASAVFDPAVKQLKADCAANPGLVTYGQFYISDTVHYLLLAQVTKILESIPRFDASAPNGATILGVPVLNQTFLNQLAGLMWSPLDWNRLTSFLNSKEVKGDLAPVRALFPSDPPGTKEAIAVKNAYWYVWGSSEIATGLPPSTTWITGLSGTLMDAAWSYEKARCFDSTTSFATKILKKRGVKSLTSTLRISQGMIAGAALTGPALDPHMSNPMVPPQTITYSPLSQLGQVVSSVGAVLDAGGLVVCGVLSGVRQDRALWGTPEHYVLAIAHGSVGGTEAVLFWDPDHNSSNIEPVFGAQWGLNFGCLFQAGSHFSTGIDDEDFDAIDNNLLDQSLSPPTFGYHLNLPRRHRYQVFYAQSRPL